MHNDKYQLSMQEYRLRLHGNSCEECRSVCQALCCRYPWKVNLDKEEFSSGQYDAFQFCSLLNQLCDKPNIACEFRSYLLNKKEDGSCIYLDQNNLCSIYENRPEVCRETVCTYTFNLSPVMKRKSLNKTNHNIIVAKDNDPKFLSEVIIPHPFVRLLAIFINKDKSRIYFLKELIRNCGKFYTSSDFHYYPLSEDQFMLLCHLFDKKERLDQIYEEFQQVTNTSLSIKEFMDIINLLLEEKVIIKVSVLINAVKNSGI
jgi:Fe-S-cluster containining protein